jgi:hypothetical protein
MPLLYSNYKDLESNQLNKAKKRIFSSAVTQYTNVGDIQSTFQPTVSQMNEYFLKITTVIKQMNEQLRAVINGADPDKVALEFGTIITEFANEFDNKIYPVYNYFSPQQNELIRNVLIKFQLIVEEILYGNFGQVIDNFIETVPEQLTNLGLAVESYSPLKITLRKGRQLITDDIGEVQGGYIAGGSRNKGMKYPEIRFM